MTGKLMAIILGGIIAGTVDIGAAALINNVDINLILHVIASGVKGKAVMHEAGNGVLILGLGLQWLMGMIIAAVYVVAGVFLPVITRRWVTFGLLYGVGIDLVMNYLVVPLSAASTKGFHFTFHPAHMAKDLVAMLVFGLIIAFFAHRAAATRRPAAMPQAATAA